MLRRIVLVFMMLLSALGGFHAFAASLLPAKTPAPDPSQILKVDTPTYQGGAMVIGSSIAKPPDLDRQSLRIANETGHPIHFTMPDGTSHLDNIFSTEGILTSNGLRLWWPLLKPDHVILHWQGCVLAALCYPPGTVKVWLPPISARAILDAPFPRMSAL